MRHGPANPILAVNTAEALDFTARWLRSTAPTHRWSMTLPYENAWMTGDRARSWLDDLIARGPFEAALLVGGSDWAPTWLAQNASRTLEVREPSTSVIDRLRGPLKQARERASLIRADLNFLVLPQGRYDVVWSDNGIRDVVNLEYLLDEIAGALRPGGLFAYHGYVGEPHQRFAPARLARINAALQEVPRRFRLDVVEAIEPTPPSFMSPLAAERSDEILPLAAARFELVHEVRVGALVPLLLSIDLPALEREAPAVLAHLQACEAEALRDPRVQPALAYVVLRKRG
jgi:SAM-dependent methyltransferase